MAEEKVFFEERGVKVTNARFVIGGETHSMSGVTSVRSQANKINRKPLFILAAIGAVAAIFHWIGFVLIAGAVAWWFLQKQTYSVILSSASGNQDALTSPDLPFIQNVVNALNDAIVHRG